MMDDDVILRSYVLTRDDAAVGDDGRTLLIRAVPWDTETQIGPDEWEAFSPASFDAQLRAAHRLKLTLGHPPGLSVRNGLETPNRKLTDYMIGTLEAMEARADGLHGRARVATSSTADDALALVRDGVIDEVSIGFMSLRAERRKRDGGGSLIYRTSARMHHLALLENGAYGSVGAKVLAVRSAGPSVRTLDELRAVVGRLA